MKNGKAKKSRGRTLRIDAKLASPEVLRRAVARHMAPPKPEPTVIRLTNVSTHTPAEAMALAASLFVLATDAGISIEEWTKAIIAARQKAADDRAVQ